MKKAILLVFAIALVSCASKETYTIKINMSDFAGTQLNLQQRTGGEMVVIDSVTLDENGVGEMSGTVNTEEMMYLGEAGQRRTLPVFMGNYNYTITGTFEDVSVEADGGPQKEYNAYKDSNAEFEKKQQEILERYNAARNANMSDDSIQLIANEYYAIDDEKAIADSIYILENPASVVTLFLLRNMFYQLDSKQLESRLTALDESLHSNNYYTFLSGHLEKMKNVEIGEKYVDFELPDTEGNPVKLSDIAGKGVLMIDFWASWCRPCRIANPEVVKIYNEFHKQDFDIIGVSLDRSKEDWLKAIDADGLVWHHVSDLKFWDCEAAQLYAVSAIPHTVLLDQEGTIVARNLEPEELKLKIEELLSE